MSTLARIGTGCAVVLALVVAGGLVMRAQGGGPNSYPNIYRAAEHWMSLPGVVEGVKYTWPQHQVVGVALDKDANILLLQRENPPILKFDPTGTKLLKSWGEGLFAEGHSISVMPDGTIWTSDNAVKDGIGGQVIHFSADGQVLMALGTKGVLGTGPGQLAGPTGVAIAKNGDIFISDGHRQGAHYRVVKYSKDGKFIKAWGEPGSGPGQFNGAHGIGIDSQGRVFVADRGNNRIQIFDQDGALLDTWKQFGRPELIFITADDTMYIPDTQSRSTSNPGFQRGIRIGSAKDGVVKYFIPDPTPEPDKVQTSSAVALALDAQGNIYTAESWVNADVGLAKMLKKYMRK